MKYYISEDDLNNFNAFFLKEFGGSYENIDFETLTERIRHFCTQETDASVFFTEAEKDALCRMQIDLRNLDDWRMEVTKKSALIHKTRIEIRASMWTVLRTIESIGFWVPDHEIATEQYSIIKFLESAEPALRQRFQKVTLSGSTFELVIPENDSIVSMHRGTLGALMSNIVANAGKHGKATSLRINSAEDAQSFKLIIEDDGSGFDDVVARKMFTMGFSGGDSTGIGLADANARMAKIGGLIHPEGHSGLPNKLDSHGAKFTLTLAKD